MGKNSLLWGFVKLLLALAFVIGVVVGAVHLSVTGFKRTELRHHCLVFYGNPESNTIDRAVMSITWPLEASSISDVESSLAKSTGMPNIKVYGLTDLGVAK